MILIFQDKLGITEGYKAQWDQLITGAKLDNIPTHRFSIYNSELKEHQLLIRSGNRKAPGFNPELLNEVGEWFENHLNKFKPRVVIMMDPALFGLIESEWNVATTDHLRGGVYPYRTAKGFETTVVVMTPISAINRRMDPKDIALMNQGAYSKAEWDELQEFKENREDGDEEIPADAEQHENEDFFIAPYKIPYGRFVLRVDLNKVYRVYHGQLQGSLRFNFHLCDNPVTAELGIRVLETASLISEDIETNPLIKKNRKKGEILPIPYAHTTCIGFTGLTPEGEAHTFLYPLTNGKSAQSGLHPMAEYSMDCAKRINANRKARFTFQNGAYDNSYLCRDGIPCENWAYDSMTMFWSLWPELPKRLDFISSVLSDSYQYWKHSRGKDDIQVYWRYCGRDCHETLCNTMTLVELLKNNERARKNFAEAHARVSIGWAMSMRGMRSDENRVAKHEAQLSVLRTEAQRKLRYLIADSEFNANSPKQRAHLIYTLLGARFRNAKGKYVKRIEDASTGQAVLRLAQDEHPVFRRVISGIIAVSEPSKQLSNVISIKTREIRPNEWRVFTSYDGVGTTTTRLSSRESPFYDGTNAQNIRKDFRDWMVADEDSFLLDIDYSAADDVFVSFESGDQKKIELFYSKKDVHATNSVLFFENWTYESVVAGKKAQDPRVVHPIRGIRQISKKVGHGCNYLMAGLTLLLTAGREAIIAAAKELGFKDAGNWNQYKLADFCGVLEKKYRTHYTRFRREGGWYDDIRAELIASRGITTAYGYYQRFLGNPRDDDVLRAAAATLGQANTAGRINDTIMEAELGFIRSSFRDGPNPHYNRTPLLTTRASHGVSLRLQSHDSITFNVSLKHPHWQEGCMRIIEMMSRPTVIKNKMTGNLETFAVRIEAEIGTRWGKSMIEWDTTPENLEATVIRAMDKNTNGSNKAIALVS